MTILLAGATSVEGAAAAQAAAQEARRRGEDVVVFHLEPDADGVDPVLEGIEVRHAYADDRARDVVGELVDLANSGGFSMVVIGLRHRTAIGKLLLGSAAQTVLLECRVPVLAVKPERD